MPTDGSGSDGRRPDRDRLPTSAPRSRRRCPGRAAGRGGDRRRRRGRRPALHLPRAAGARRPRGARRSSSSSAGARRSASSSAPAEPSPGVVARSRSPTGSAPTDRSCRRCRSRSRAGSRTTTSRRRPSSSGRCCRRGCWSGSSSSPSGPPRAGDAGASRTSAVTGRRGPARAARRRAATGPGPRRAGGRAGLLRRLRALAGGRPGRARLDPVGAGAGPRFERWVARRRSGCARPLRRWSAPLGPRQLAALAELEAAAGCANWPAPGARRATRIGDRRVARPSRPRRGRGPGAAAAPARHRPPGLRGARPPATALTADQAPAAAAVLERVATRRPAADPPRRRHRRRQDRDLRRGHRRVARARPAGARPRARDRPGAAARRPAPRGPRRPGRAGPLRPRRRGAGRRVAAHPGGRRRHRRRDPAGGPRAARRRRGRHRRRGARCGLQERPDAAAPGPRRRHPARGLAGAAVVLGSRRRRSSRSGARAAGSIDRVVLPTRASGRPPTVEVVDLRAELADGNRGLLSRPLAAALDGLDRPPASRRSSSSTGAAPRRSSCVATAGTSRPARIASGRSSTTRPAARCAATTAGGRRPIADRCPACALAADPLPRRRHGAGRARGRGPLPGAAVARLDRDVVERRGAAERVIDAFTAGGLDVLVGTSLVDQGPRRPDGHARRGRVGGRRAQPARRARGRADVPAARPGGRAGRARGAARAARSSRPTSPTTRRSVRSWPAMRRRSTTRSWRCGERFGSPPFGRLIKLTVALADRDAAEAEGGAMVDRLRERARDSVGAIDVAGPAPAYIARRNDRWRFNVVLRGDDPRAVLGDDPGPPWSVDVDPESLL